MALTTYLGNKLLDHAIGKTAYVLPAPYVALFTVAPTIAGGGTECLYTGYTRISAPALFGAAASLSSTNTSAIIFPAKTAGTDETVAYWATFDASTAGNMLEFGTITASKLIQNGDIPSFAISALTRTVS